MSLKILIRTTRGQEGFSGLTGCGNLRIFIASQSTTRCKRKYRNFNQEELMKIKPLGDRVLVKNEESEDRTAGGIYIPQTAQEKTQTGIVVEVGDDKDVIKVKKGDRIMFDKYAGTTVKIEGVDHLIMKMDDILVVIV